MVATERFDFTGPGGRRLSGRLEVPSGHKKGWALFAHCFTCGKDNLAAVRIARALAAQGIGTLRFDFSGLGESEGDHGETSFAAEVEDIVAAAGAMESAGKAPCLLIGHSLGGAAVLAAAEQLPGVAAYATIAAPFDIDHLLTQLPEAVTARALAEGEADLHIGDRTVTLGRHFLEDLRRHDQGARIAALHRPLLILHSPRDRTVPIDEATSIFTAARHPKSFISLDPADHLLTDGEHANRAAAMIAAWAAPYLIEPAQEPIELDAVAEETGAGKFQVAIRAGGARFFADEPVSVGGLGSGPSPYDLLSSALAACTTMTVRLYADGKNWPVTRIRTAVGHMRENGATPPDHFIRRVAIEGTVDSEQRARLLEIANRCPVHRTLEQGARVTTTAGEPPASSEPAEAHALAMERVAGN